MNVNFLPYLIVWIALAVAVIVLLLRHRLIAGQEDAHLDVLETATVAQQHMALEHKLEVVDKWGKILTVAAVVYGVGLGALYLYQSWEQMSRIGL